MVASTSGVFGQKESISGISRVREGGQGQRGGSGYQIYAEIGESLRWVWHTPMNHSSGLAASLGKKREGKWRGGSWLLIDAGERRIGQGIKRRGGILAGKVSGIDFGGGRRC
jgi:hypothetical protein